MLDLGQLNDHIRALDKQNEDSRKQTIHSLKEYAEPDWSSVPNEAAHSLVKSLQNQLLSGLKQVPVRQDVVTILGNIGPRAAAAVPQLVELLKDGVPDSTREAAADALGKIGKDAKVAVDQLIALLAHCRPALAIHVVRALSDIGCADQRVRNALVSLWLSPSQSQNNQVRIAGALCKLKVDAEGLLRFLTRSLVAAQDSAVRKSAAEALAWCNKNDDDVVPALLTSALNDKDEKVREIAEASLTHLRLPREKAIQICLKQLKDSPLAETALRNSGTLAVPALIEALKGEEPSTREKAARTLGTFGELAVLAVPGLTKALRDKNLDARLAAAKALWNVTKSAELVVPVLVDLLDGGPGPASEAGEPRRRYLQTVIEALWRIGPPAQAAVPALKDMVRDKNRHISESALSALKEIAPAAAAKAGSRK